MSKKNTALIEKLRKAHEVLTDASYLEGLEKEQMGRVFALMLEVAMVIEQEEAGK